jgi:hypothetical protein
LQVRVLPGSPLNLKHLQENRGEREKVIVAGTVAGPLKGTYVNVEPFHLFRYLDEQVFRYNNRATKDRFVGDGDRFQMLMRHIAGRRVTYQELTGKGTDTVHHDSAGTRPS